MLNKKKLGLGMLIAGGALAVTGAILTRKGMQAEKEAAMEEELANLENDECIDDCEDCEDCGEHLDKKEEHYTNIPSTEVSPIPVEWMPYDENVIKARKSTSTYNPAAKPTSMSQEDIEAVGATTF